MLLHAQLMALLTPGQVVATSGERSLGRESITPYGSGEPSDIEGG